MEATMIKFANADYLYALLLVPLLLLLFVMAGYLREKNFKKFSNKALWNVLMPEISAARRWLKFVLFMLAYILLVIAVANPQTGTRIEEVKREGIDLFIALDVSKSMLAEDILPNRLDRSKQAISRLIDRLGGDRIGIIVFAGRAYVQLPVTTDYAAAKLFLSTINTDIVPIQGTAIGEAINLAVESFGESNSSKAIIIISDGEDHEDDPVDAARNAAAQGVQVYTIGMGLADGAPIPIYNRYGNRTGFHTDRQGNTVITKLDARTLQQIAAAGNGAYTRANNLRSGLDFMYDQISKLDKSEIDSKVFTDYESRFQIFLALALLVLLVEMLIASGKRSWETRVRLFEKKKVKP